MGPAWARIVRVSTPAAERFDQALHDRAPGSQRPELLPARLARACTEALPVDGAGLSLHAGPLHLPIGASSLEAAHAEQLQFTFGEGPCLRAHDDGRTIAFDPDAIHRNWPQLYRSFMADTPYRGVLSVPLPEPLGSTVVLDLFLRETAALGRLERADVAAVAQRVTAELARDLRADAGVGTGASTWLEAPDAQRRARTWQAVARVGMALVLGPADALEVIRAAAISSGRTVDEVAIDLLTGRVQPLDLGAAPIPDDD